MILLTVDLLEHDIHVAFLTIDVSVEYFIGDLVGFVIGSTIGPESAVATYAWYLNNKVNICSKYR